jgi:hypothetical protein
MSDILAVQQDITARISEKLRLKLSGEEKHGTFARFYSRRSSITPQFSCAAD